MVDSTTVQVDESSLAAARAQARARATELWGEGLKEESLEVLRRARLDYGPDSWSCFAYGTRLIQIKRGWAGRQALHDAVDLDPTNLDALEHFVEAEARFPAPTGTVSRAFHRLTAALPTRPATDVDALGFLIPAMKRSTDIQRGIRGLEVSESPVARLASHLVFSDQSMWPTLCEQLAEDITQARVARAVVLLGTGQYTKAYEELDPLEPESVPIRPLRLAIRRELRRGREKQSIKLLQHYTRAKPDDAWASSRLINLQTVKPLSHYQLATKGYPFRKATSKASYEARADHALYCLHNSLPHHSAGYATRTHGLLRGLRREGWDVHGVTRLGYPYDMPGHESLGPVEPTIEVDGVPYHRLSTTPGIEMKNPIQLYVERYAKALRGLAQKHRPFVLHAASNHWNGLAVVETARALGIPSVYEVRGLWEVTRGSRDPEWMGGGMYRYMARMEADAAKYATKVLTITTALQDELVNRGVDPDKITVVPNGVETARFEPRERNVELEQRLNLTGRTVVGYVGSILDYEGLELLIDAAATFRAEGSDMAFLLVGDGAELSQFRERVESEGLGDTVIFTGRVPHHEVEDYYSLIDICPFPRLPLPVCEMVSPLKPFEAMAMGKVVVSSDVAALAEIVQDGVTGLLHHKGDAESLTDKLRLLRDDQHLRDRLARQGLEWVRAERDWSNLAKTVSGVYADLGGVLRKSSAT